MAAWQIAESPDGVVAAAHPLAARAGIETALLVAGAGAALAWLPGTLGLFSMFAGLGLSAGANAVIVGALWAELFGTRQLGMIRGVYAALMVGATAVSPVLLGAALAAGIAVDRVGGLILAWCVLVPGLAVARVRRGRQADPG